jgi:hypothetical protein
MNRPVETLRQYLLKEFKSGGIPAGVQARNPITIQGIYDGQGIFYDWHNLIMILRYIVDNRKKVSRKIHNMILMVPPEGNEQQYYLTLFDEKDIKIED